MPLRSTAAALAISAVLLTTTAVHAQSAAHQHATPPNGMPMDHAAHHAAMGAMPPSGPSSAVPTMPGQDAFGTIQEGSVGVEC